MNRHFLVTISDDAHAFYAVRFLGQFFQRKQDLDCTLFYVAPSVHVRASGAIKPDAAELAKGEAALDLAKGKLMQQGWPKEHIHLKTMAQRHSTPMEIVEEGERGKYDAVVLGRRGVSTLEAMLGASVSHDLLNSRITFPLWLCRMPEATRSGVLCGVDGSEQAFRVVDHVGFILAGRRDQHITLCGVDDGNHPDLDRVFDRCREMLKENGVPPEMIRQQLLQGGDPAKALRTELHDGGYAVIALGRTGAGGGALRNLFYGSVSSRLIHDAPPATVWISR